MSVTLRIRILKIRGPEHRIAGDITLRAGSTFLRVSSSKSEWCIFTLAGPDDEILFQTPYEDSSCKCRELDGRKRIDFKDGVSILVEAYWVLTPSDDIVIRPQAEAIRKKMIDCEISFMATRGPPSSFLMEHNPQQSDWLGSFGSGAYQADELEEPLVADGGPVSKALGWFREPVVTRPLEERQKYVPGPGGRVKWDVKLTAMHKHDTVSALRDVNISLNLNKLYMIAPDL